tara:strand:+ start:92 stop:748 length:657 start_codon:yes stop_codon:yes gene_type:complete
MKKIELLLLIIPMIGFGQFPFEIEGTIEVAGQSLYYYDEGSGIVVPQGKIYQLKEIISDGFNDGFNTYVEGERLMISDDRNQPLTPISIWNNNFPDDGFIGVTETTLLSEGTIIRILQDGTYFNATWVFLVYDISQLNLAYNAPEKHTPTLYPNPTSSLLALNSDKEYDIEVYDMAGNKVMALTGNTLNMANLSTATYIVKTIDKSNNEELTYRVVKN